MALHQDNDVIVTMTSETETPPETQEMILFKETTPSSSSDSSDEDPIACLEDPNNGPYVKTLLCYEDSHNGPNVKQLKCGYLLNTWNLAKLIKTLGNREQCIAFAEEQGLVARNKMCSIHRKPMSIRKSSKRSFGSWACYKKTCRDKIISRTRGTFFEHVCLNLYQVFYLIYAFAHKWDFNMVIIQDPWKDIEQKCLSKRTVWEWYKNCRKVVVETQKEFYANKAKIGGPGKDVQIGVFNHKTTHNTYIVLGMIEDESDDLRLEVCPNENSAEVLLPLIKENVEEGTTIHIDNWNDYESLDQHGFILKKLDASKPDNIAVGPSGTHTQRIKAQWFIVKKHFKKASCHNVTSFRDSLLEYLWRRYIKNYRKDPFMEMIRAIKNSYKIN